MFGIKFETDEEAKARYAGKREAAEKKKTAYLGQNKEQGSPTGEGFDQHQSNVARWGTDKVTARRILVLGNKEIPLPLLFGRRVKV